MSIQVAFLYGTDPYRLAEVSRVCAATTCSFDALGHVRHSSHHEGDKVQGTVVNRFDISRAFG